ncbi:MAG: hypothetical protein GXP48_02010 [Acidobacteria bacterium]|nr:hypothetical protein [Acidobacteriota bacterium]
MSPEPGHHQTDYDPRHVVAAKSVLVELGQILAPYRQAVVLVGGWVPRLLFPEAEPPHIGSTDVDVLLDPPKLPGLQYADLLELLEAHGYRKTDRSFKFERDVPISANEVITVELDFLVPKGVRRGRSGRFVKDFRAIEAEGARLVLTLSGPLTVDARMPSGVPNQVRISVPTVEAFVVMKAHALGGRLKEKDAYDLVFCLRHCEGGSTAVAEALRPFKSEAEVQQALKILGEKFRSPEDFGPSCVVRFQDPADPEEREFIARDAYERVQTLLKALDDEAEASP